MAQRSNYLDGNPTTKFNRLGSNNNRYDESWFSIMANPTLSDVDQKLSNVLTILAQIQTQVSAIESRQTVLEAKFTDLYQLVSNIEAAVINLGTPGV